MHRYIALIDGKAGGYGVSFPDLPGCVAMAPSIDEAFLRAADALREFEADVTVAGASMPPPATAERLRESPEVAAALRDGATLVSVPLVRETARSVKANLSINAGVLAALDAEAARQGLTRSALVEAMARRLLASDA
jgi:predicted RNase H-like HicB family nuclease